MSMMCTVKLTVSIKVDKCDLVHLYNIKSNRKGICKSGQIIGQLEPVSSYSEAARECQRLNCDYFTIGFYRDNNQNIIDRDTVTKTNSAQFCVGDPVGLYSDGYLMAERVHAK
ncbi:hypothetical protein MACK_003372 [Theileria orientalis]|uniref:Uncharacterized protein n=1 Tax=Theileria orientalis TaxID=68886 RepID=A0A976SIK3_THEOR|nr:hypothetical protein MACK_003372 [Theileria orientalis]